ncbi:ABC transporter permease [Desulfogranum japonicum]|uniref:ABC transporter permease n=1 Tax=Desulfogranum japonicum TaxID=231447 RepID=UPI00041365D0|nr:ABC transporter permease [Desulfogranum japonicum]
MSARLHALIIKEFLALFRDKKSRLAIIIPPIVQLLVFGYAATFDLEHVNLAIWDEDHSPISRELSARFSNSTAFELVGHVDNGQEASTLINTTQALLVLHISPQCSQSYHQGESCPVQILIDGRNSNTAMLALNYVRDIISTYNADLLEELPNRILPVQLEMRARFNPNLVSRWFIVPGIVALLGMIVTLLVTSLSVAREREAGTFDQLLVTPLRLWEILIGKAMPGLVVGVAESSLIILITVYWFKVPLLGSLAALYAGLTIYILAIIGVGLMISSMSTTLQQALLGAFLFIVPAVILSGFATPIANMPKFMQTMTYLDPMRYFLIIVRRVYLEGAVLTEFGHQLWPMTIIAALTLTAATWLFRHRMY